MISTKVSLIEVLLVNRANKITLLGKKLDIGLKMLENLIKILFSGTITPSEISTTPL